MPLIDLIAGARPNFMKIAPLVHALAAHAASGGPLRYRLVHTGQHYDKAMSGDFFEQLGIPEPDVNLAAGSGTQAEQTAQIMVRYEQLLLSAPCDCTLVVGDVNSTMACAIAARKLGIPVAHVEAGIRSGDWSMPEEINRVVTDSITNWFFTTSEWAGENLRRAGAHPDSIFFVGNTMIDTLMAQRRRFRAPDVWEASGLSPRSYIVTTLHRPSNVDRPEHLARLLDALTDGAAGAPVVFPVHPRTRRVLDDLGRQWDGLLLVPPLPYLEFNFLVEHAMAVVTDSGGVTEETTVLGVPCMTLRDSTERPETVTVGTNELIGTDLEALRAALAKVRAGQWKTGRTPEKWDGQTASRIVGHLRDLVMPQDNPPG